MVTTHQVRPATEQDLVACHGVWRSTQADLADHEEPSVTLPLHVHELAKGRLLVAEVNHRVVGFGATLERSGTTYLADLFVRPEHHGHGIGRALVNELLGGIRGPRFTFASESPSAQHLYASMGMESAEQFSYLRADLAQIELGHLNDDGVTAAVTGLTPELIELDRLVTRRDRSADMSFANKEIGSKFVVSRIGSEIVGYGAFTYPFTWIDPSSTLANVGPIVVADPAYLIPTLKATLEAVTETAASTVEIMVPSSSPAHKQLRDVGFSIFSEDVYMTSDPAIIDTARYLPSVDCA